MKTSEQSLYTLVTMFIQLDGRTYWLYAKIRSVSLIDFSKTASFES